MVPVVNKGRLLPRYKHLSKRFLLFDFEGAVCIRAASSRHPNSSSKPLPYSNVFLTTTERSAVVEYNTCPMAVPGVGIVAGNGYIIRTRETKKMPATWIDIVANLKFTWKEPCIEIFNYVRPTILLIPFALD